MVVTNWTGVEVFLMRTAALRITQKELAERLGCHEAAVRKWEGRKETITLVREFAAAMDTVYSRLTSDQRERFHMALGSGPVSPSDRSASVVDVRLPELRRVLDAHDMPEDGPVRPLELLRGSVASAIDDRLNSNYRGLACELPSLLAELHRARLSDGYERVEVSHLLVQAYRAADAIADKYGYFDLSARIIAMMCATAADADDDLLTAATAYVRTEAFFNNGQFCRPRCGIRGITYAGGGGGGPRIPIRRCSSTSGGSRGYRRSGQRERVPGYRFRSVVGADPSSLSRRRVG